MELLVGSGLAHFVPAEECRREIEGRLLELPNDANL
jgi:hypothetical protein